MTSTVLRFAVLVVFALAGSLAAQEMRLDLAPGMVTNETNIGEPEGMVDEQKLTAGPPAGGHSAVGTA